MRIEELPAGREMDALIAEHIFKWRKMRGPKTDYDGPCESFDVLIPPDIEDPFPLYSFRGSIKPWYFCSKWSTQLAAAWEVVETLGELGYTCVIEWKGSDRFYAGTAEVNIVKNLYTVGLGVGTFPEALSRAALMAMGVTEL